MSVDETDVPAQAQVAFPVGEVNRRRFRLGQPTPCPTVQALPAQVDRTGEIGVRRGIICMKTNLEATLG